MKFGWKFALFVGLILVLMVGCATPSRTEFSTFAQAGGGYATAVDKLLVAAGTAQVDSTSWSLVAEKVDTGMDETTYKKKNTEDLARLDEIGRLRQHAQLLGQYFGLLEALATSDAPQRTQNSIEGIMEAIRGLNLQLPTGMSALPPIGQLAADLKIRTALREELENRKETIRLELLIQEALLKKLSEQIKHALNLDKRVQEDTLVIDPLVEKKPLEKPEQWISTRQRIVYITSTIQEIGSASQAATKLREAFEGLLAGEITIGRLNALITDIEAMLAIAETIRS
jgi:hypothetical protein